MIKSMLRSNNSLWLSDTIWRHRSGSTLVPIMACCLTAPSHYLNQCWLTISGILSEGNFTCSRYLSLISVWKLLILRLQTHLPGPNVLKHISTQGILIYHKLNVSYMHKHTHTNKRLHVWTVLHSNIDPHGKHQYQSGKPWVYIGYCPNKVAESQRNYAHAMIVVLPWYV